MSDNVSPKKKSPRSPGDPLIVLPRELHANLHKLVGGDKVDLWEYIAQILQDHLDVRKKPEGVEHVDHASCPIVGNTPSDPQNALDHLGKTLRAEIAAQLTGVRSEIAEQTKVIQELAEQQRQTYDLLSVLVDALDDEYEDEEEDAEEDEEENTTDQVTVL